jgi:putative salt-induced outer membrane protein
VKHTLTAISLLIVAGPALAQATVKDDGQWRSALGLAASSASGNSKSTSFAANADAVRATKQDKWALYANALYGESSGTKSADQFRLGTKYDWNLGTQTYAFGSLELERDAVAKLNSRATLGGGLGYRVINTEPHKFEVFGGAAYVSDRYDGARLLDGQLRSSYSYPSLILGEESSHKLGQGTTVKQRLVIYPNLKNTGEYRAQWDAGIAVAATAAMSLNVGLSVKVNSDPGVGVKKTDTLFLTGVSFKFD